jgi:autotransporter-associated beta strand protein
VTNGTFWLGGGTSLSGAAFVDSSVTMNMAANTILRVAIPSVSQGMNGNTGYVASVINSAGNLTILDGNSDQVGSYSIPFTGPINMANNSTLLITNELSGNVPQPLTLAGGISGGGVTVVKGGGGRLTINGPQTYTGSTFIYAGGLAVGNNASFASSGIVFSNFSSTNILDTSGNANGLTLTQPLAPPNAIKGSLTLSNGCVMANGALNVGINGSLTITNGGQLQPGTTLDTGIINVSNNLVLGGNGSNTNLFLNVGPSYA